MSSVLHFRGTAAALSRSRPPDDPDLLEARRGLAAANIEAYIERIVSGAPPLSEAQRERIAALLHGGNAS